MIFRSCLIFNIKLIRLKPRLFFHLKKMKKYVAIIFRYDKLPLTQHTRNVVAKLQGSSCKGGFNKEVDARKLEGWQRRGRFCPFFLFGVKVVFCSSILKQNSNRNNQKEKA